MATVATPSRSSTVTPGIRKLSRARVTITRALSPGVGWVVELWPELRLGMRKPRTRNVVTRYIGGKGSLERTGRGIGPALFPEEEPRMNRAASRLKPRAGLANGPRHILV